MVLVVTTRFHIPVTDRTRCGWNVFDFAGKPWTWEFKKLIIYSLDATSDLLTSTE